MTCGPSSDILFRAPSHVLSSAVSAPWAPSDAESSATPNLLFFGYLLVLAATFGLGVARVGFLGSA